MTNLLDSPVYTSWQDVLDTTTITGLITELTADINYADWLITQAQRIIDDYIWRYGVPFVDWQQFVFPIDVDWVSIIPEDIQLTTIYIVEYLYQNGWTSGGSWSASNIKSEKNLWRSITYKDGSWSTISNNIPLKALSLLDKYKGNLFVWQVI